MRQRHSSLNGWLFVCRGYLVQPLPAHRRSVEKAGLAIGRPATCDGILQCFVQGSVRCDGREFGRLAPATFTPRQMAPSATISNKRVLPTPGSPSTSTKPPRPSQVLSTALSKAAYSCRRPTKDGRDASPVRLAS